jgi:hypothetical protein
MSTNNKKSSDSYIESPLKRKLLFFLYILPPVILLFLIIFISFPNIDLDKFIPFILPSIAAGISLVIGLSTRNASISERARSKAAELLKYIKEGENEYEREECLYKQMIRFEHRFQLNQTALFVAWISLFLGLFIGFVLSYGQRIDWISTKLPILVISLLSYSFLVTLWDIALGSTTLALELRNVEKFCNKEQKSIEENQV